MARYDSQSAELEQTMERLKNIMTRINYMSNSGSRLVDRADDVNRSAVKQAIPRFLDEDCLSVLTQDATKKKLYGLIIQFYEKSEQADSDGEIKTVYKLKDDVSSDELEMIKKGLESLDYFSASSMAMQGFSKLKKSFFS